MSTPRRAFADRRCGWGQFDLANVTVSETTIREVAGIELHLEPLHLDRLSSSEIHRLKLHGPEPGIHCRPLTAKEIADFPLILPEPDASRRQHFDRFAKANGKSPNAMLEVGGWSSLLQFVQFGIGVGFATEQAVAAYEAMRSTKSTAKSSMVVRAVDENEFLPDQARLIARRQQGRDMPDLSRVA